MKPLADEPGGRDEAVSRFHPRHAKQSSVPLLHAEKLYDLLGIEQAAAELARRLRGYVQSLRPPVVGAMRVSCSDEAEQESIEAFQRNFVRLLLPSHKFYAKSPFRAANLGGRYEWGSVRIAEDHYALAQGAEDWKVLVVKVNSHVSIEDGPDGPRFGRTARYGSASVYCGALDAVLGGSDEPFAHGLAEELAFECVERLETLRDPARVSAAHRNLVAAAVNARVQARRAMIDLQDYTPNTPTLYLVLPCVTLNRRGHDGEVLCGIYTADRRTAEPHDEYCGLGDRPERIRVAVESGRVHLSDTGMHRPRRARDHRELVEREWNQRDPTHRQDPGVQEALDEVLEEAGEPTPRGAFARAALQSLLGVLLEVSPVPAAVLLFGEGLVAVHHAARAHRLVREATDDRVAREMLRGIQDEIGALPPERAEHLVQLLLNEYGR